MTLDEALQVADKVLFAHTGKHLTDLQRMILKESLSDKVYPDMLGQGWELPTIRNAGNKLWSLLSEALGEEVSKTSFRGALEKRLKSLKLDLDWQELCRTQETKYLESITERFQVWWKRDASWMEIDEPDWFKFGLKIKMPKSNREENSSYAGYEGKEHLPVPILEALDPVPNEPVLIIGKPGAGKSTFLAQVLQKAAEKALQDSTAPIPVLIALKSYGEQPDIKHLIRAAFEEENFLLGIPEPERLIYIENLIKDKRLLLLADGVNELPEERARNSLKAFCRKQMPMIFTTRDTSAGNLGIQKKLEIQPLSSGEVEKFLRNRLPGRDQNRVRELCDRVRDFGQTPLMAWMLYSVFKQKDTIPATRGEAYREFTTIYSERAKEGFDLEQSRSLLGKLAFEMMQSHKPEDFRLEISEDDAKDLFGELNQENALKHLRNHHLLQNEQRPENCKLRFCHQSLQEYYAAEELFRMARQGEIDLTSKEFQQFYLNYQKWTEPIALMLGLIDESNFRGSGREKLEQIVKLALETDFGLGSILAGSVQHEFQARTIKLVSNLKVQQFLKTTYLGNTRSEYAVPIIQTALTHENLEIRKNAVKALGQIATLSSAKVLDAALNDEEPTVREAAASALGKIGSEQAIHILVQKIKNENDDTVRGSIAEALGKTGSESTGLLLKQWKNQDSETAYVTLRIEIALWRIFGNVEKPILFQELISNEPLFQENLSEDIDTEVALDSLVEALKHEIWTIRRNAVIQLSKRKESRAFLALLQAIDDVEPIVRREVVRALRETTDPTAVPAFLKALKDEDPITRRSAAFTLGNLRSQEAVHGLTQTLQDSDGNVRDNSITALGRIGGKEASLALIKEFNKGDPRTCRKCLEAIGEIGDTSAAPYLLQALINRNHPATNLIGIEFFQVLGKVADEKLLPEFCHWRMQATEVEHIQLFTDAIVTIQSRCGFYNYEIKQRATQRRKTDRTSTKN